MAFQKRREATPTSLAQRILAIFEVFQEGNCSLTLSEISQRTGLPLTTSFRLLSTLTEWGALDRGPDRRYAIGARIVDLAALAPPRRHRALPPTCPSGHVAACPSVLSRDAADLAAEPGPQSGRV